MPKLASFQVKLANFLSEKGRFCFCYDRYTSAVICKVEELHLKQVKISSGYSSIKDRYAAA